MIISTPFPPEEGIGFYTYNLAKKLKAKGHEVTILTRGNALKNTEFEFDGLKVIQPKFIPLYPFHVDLHGMYVKKVIKKLENNIDLIHVHTPLSPVVTTKLPMISTIHTSVIEDAKHLELHNMDTLKWRVLTKLSSQRLTQKLINKSKFVTTVSSSVAEELVKYYDIKKPIVIGNGVDENVFVPRESPKEDFYVLYVARLDYRKGVLDLIKASKMLKSSGINILIAGDGPLRKHFEKEILDNELDHVKLLGHVSGQDLVKLYQNAAIFVFPSLYEGLPTVLLEAMSCALPVIASDIPAHRDLIKNRDNGILVKPNTPKELVNEILKLKNDEDLRYKLGKNARKTIEEQFTWSIITEKLEKLYNHVSKVKRVIEW